MYCRSRPQYRSDLGWILGVAFLGTLTRSARPAQGFTYVRCCSAPPASSPHGLTAPGRVVSRRPTRVQLPSACGCFQLAPQRTCTSNPGSMPGTPRLALRAPALRAASALTRPSISAQWLPCGRHTVPTGKMVGPNNVVANHRVERGDHLAHDGHDHNLRQ